MVMTHNQLNAVAVVNDDIAVLDAPEVSCSK